MPKRSRTENSSSARTRSSPRGQWWSSLARSRLFVFVADVVRAGDEAQLSLFAPAMAYALVVSLAPLTVVLRYFGDKVASSVLPGSPLSGIRLTGGQVAGRLFAQAGPLAPVLTVVLVVWGGSALFVQFVDAIHRIWGDAPKGGMRGTLISRGAAVLLLIVTGLSLVASSMLGTTALQLSAIAKAQAGQAGALFSALASLASRRVVVDFIGSAVLFAVAFTAVPRGRQHLRTMLPGVVLTAAAYALGQQALGLYLSRTTHAGTLGTFGQFVAFMLWAYYTSTIVLWGATTSHLLASRRSGRQDSASKSL